MKRTKKFLVGFLVALSVFCSSFGLAACVVGNVGGNQNSSNKDSSSISSEEDSSSSSSQGGGNTDDSSNGGNGGGTVEDDPISDYDDIISDGDLRG